MSFAGVFAIGLSGVNAYAESLESVSNNIANTQTTGFKRSRTDFSSLITFETAGGGGIQAGGVGAENRVMVTEQGSVTRTGSQTDLAILGDGFFVVSPQDGADDANLLTRAGQFSIQEDGTLRNEAGYALMGASISDGDASVTSASLSSLQIVDVNQISGLAEATSNISLSGALSNTATPGDVFSHRVQTYDANGDIQDVIFNFTNVNPTTWIATASLAGAPGSSIASGSLVFNGAGSLDRSASSFPQSFAPSGQAPVSVDLAGLRASAGASRITQSTAMALHSGASRVWKSIRMALSQRNSPMDCHATSISSLLRMFEMQMV